MLKVVASLVVCCVIGAGAALAAEQDLPQPLPLERAVAIALERYGAVAAAAQQASGAAEAVKEARAAFLPEVVASWQYSWFRNAGQDRLASIPLPSSSEQHQFLISYQQNLLNSGLTSNRVRQAKATAAAARASLEDVRQLLVLQVTERYYVLLRAKRLRGLAQEQVNQAQRHLELVQARIEAGLGAKADRLPVEAELASANVRLLAAENDVRLAASDLRNVMGLPVGPDPEPVEPAEPVFDQPQVSSLQAQAAAQRPDLKRAKHEVDAADRALRLAVIARRPLTSLDAGYSVLIDPRPTDNGFVLQASVGLPIFDAEARKSRERQARSQLNAATIQAQQLAKDAQNEVQRAYLSLINAQERIGAAAVSVEQAKSSLDAFEAKLKVGLAIPIEVIDAQVTYFNAQIEAISARYDWFVAKAALSRAIGAPIPPG